MKRNRFRETLHKLAGLDDTPKKIALGAALGVFIGVFPNPPYAGPFIAPILAHFFKLNKMAAVLGTFIMNPLFSPFFWTLSAVVGALIFGGNPVFIAESIRVAVGQSDLVRIKALGLFLLLVYLVGNIIVCSVCATLTYFLTLEAVKKYKIKKKKLKRLKRKLLLKIK